MIKILLDTSAYAEFFSGNRSVLSYLARSEITYVSVIVIGELFAGFYGGTKISQNRSELNEFLKKPGICLLEIDLETAEIFGELKNSLKKAGSPLPINDIWIAAHSIQTGSKLITFDRHFLRVPGLRIWDELVPDRI